MKSGLNITQINCFPFQFSTSVRSEFMLKISFQMCLFKMLHLGYCKLSDIFPQLSRYIKGTETAILCYENKVSATGFVTFVKNTTELFVL